MNDKKHWSPPLLAEALDELEAYWPDEHYTPDTALAFSRLRDEIDNIVQHLSSEQKIDPNESP